MGLVDRRANHRVSIDPRPGHSNAVTDILLEVDVERSVLDTFDAWTRFETMPRARRRHLVGDRGAVRVRSGVAPTFAPSAITVVEPHGDRSGDGYRGVVWIRRRDTTTSVVVLALDDAAQAECAATDLARFVEFVLVDGIDDSIRRLLTSADVSPPPERGIARP